MDISITGSVLAIIVGAIAVGVVVFIFLMKSIYSKRSKEGLSQSGDGQPLAARTKYAGADVFRYTSTFFNLGLLLAVGLTVLAFGWTQYEERVDIPEGALDVPDEIEVEPPRTAEPPPPPPPPPPPVIEEVPDEEILEDEEVTFEDQSISEESVVEAPVVEDAPPPPPPPPPPEPTAPEIFKVVEEMPRFPGCEDLPKAERKACADKKMLEFIYKNIKYPAIARENGVEGTAVVQFVVEPDGTISKINAVRDPGAQTGAEAERVVRLMEKEGIKWIPGQQRGRPVRVQFNLPVKFRLE